MRLIDGDTLVMLLTDWWYASFGQTETQESKAIKAVLDQVEIHVKKHGCKPCELVTQMSLPSHENAMLKEIATKLAEEIKSDLIITDFSGNTRTITATKAAPNIPATPPVYAVSADDVIESMESELELCNRVLDDLDIVGTEREIHSRVAEMLREQIDFVKGLPQVEPEPRKGKWIGKYPVTSACSECNYLIHNSKVKVFAYCPNCGAKMEEQDAKI